MCVDVCESVYLHKGVQVPGTGGGRGRRRSQIPLELELQVALSYPEWVLGTELWLSARTKTVLNLSADFHL